MLTDQSYTVQLPVFEGPLDLLLELIERAEFDITKISLAKVTNQYLAYLKQIQEYQLEDLASFLVIAARLVQIKSEALLPRPPIREPGEEDPGDALARQLIAYKRYKQVAVLLSEREKAGLKTFLRISTPPKAEPKIDLEGITIQHLHKAMIEALEHAPQERSFERDVSIPRVRVRDKIISIVSALRKSGTLSFKRIVMGAKSKLEVIVSFLAVLELIKQDQIIAEQDGLFDDIVLTPSANWDEDQAVEFELEFEE